MPVLLQVSNKQADADEALRQAVPSMFQSFSINTTFGDLHFNGYQATAIAAFVTKLLNSNVEVFEQPKVCHPMNAIGGLYMVLKYSDGTPRDAIVSKAKHIAAQHGGFDAEGRSTMGVPVRHSLDSVTIAVWFHDLVH